MNENIRMTIPHFYPLNQGEERTSKGLSLKVTLAAIGALLILTGILGSLNLEAFPIGTVASAVSIGTGVVFHLLALVLDHVKNREGSSQTELQLENLNEFDLEQVSKEGVYKLAEKAFEENNPTAFHKLYKHLPSRDLTNLSTFNDNTQFRLIEKLYDQLDIERLRNLFAHQNCNLETIKLFFTFAIRNYCNGISSKNTKKWNPARIYKELFFNSTLSSKRSYLTPEFSQELLAHCQNEWKERGLTQPCVKFLNADE